MKNNNSLTVSQQEICEEVFQRKGKAGVGDALMSINKRWQRKGGYRPAVQQWFFNRVGEKIKMERQLHKEAHLIEQWAEAITAEFLPLPCQIETLYCR